MSRNSVGMIQASGKGVSRGGLRYPDNLRVIHPSRKPASSVASQRKANAYGRARGCP